MRNSTFAIGCALALGAACGGDHVSWEAVAKRPGHLDTGLGMIAAGHAGRIYFAPVATPATFLASCSVGGGVRDEPLPDEMASDFNGMGYGATLVGRDGDLFMYGDYGQQFHEGAWYTIPMPGVAHRGEAAVAVVGGRIFLIGGRSLGGDATDSNQSVDVGAQWHNRASYLFAVRGAVAAGVDQHLLYVMGGALLDGNETRAAAVYDVDLDTWTRIPDLPAGFAGAVSGGAIAERPFALDRRHDLYIYDPDAQRWDDPIALPDGPSWRAVGLDGIVYAVGDDGQDAVVFRMVEP